MIELKNVSKYYNNNGVITLGLRNINLTFEKNEIVAIVGESGSGKSTLLNVICGVDSYEEGEILFNGYETSYFNQEDMDTFRRKNVSFIYQNYNIIESYTVLENVMFPLLINGSTIKEAKENLENAETAFDGEDWAKATEYAKASLAALDGVREITPLPEYYIVKPWAETKDCYWNISGRPYVYNNPLLWENLYQANKQSMPKPEDPNLIHPGMKMKIPSLTGEYRKGTYDPKKSYSTYGE